MPLLSMPLYQPGFYDDFILSSALLTIGMYLRLYAARVVVHTNTVFTFVSWFCGAVIRVQIVFSRETDLQVAHEEGEYLCRSSI